MKSSVAGAEILLVSRDLIGMPDIMSANPLVIGRLLDRVFCMLTGEVPPKMSSGFAQDTLLASVDAGGTEVLMLMLGGKAGTKAGYGL